MAHDPIGMILAAGLGTRLRPITLLKAKPAVPFLNRPLIQYSQELLAQAGVQETVVNLHHLPDTVRRAVSPELSERIHFSPEDPIQGTAGALFQARRWLAGRTIVLVNGKIYFEQTLREVLRFHRDQRATVTMVLVPFEPGASFNPVLLDSENRVREFAIGGRRRSPGTDATPDGLRPFVFTGVQVLAPEVLEFVPQGVSDTVRDVYPRLMREGRRVLGFVSPARWCEASTPSRYLSNSLELLRRKGVSCLPPAPIGVPWTRTVLGPRARIDPEAELENCVVWDDAEIAAGNRCVNAIVTEGVRIPSGQGLVEHCIVTSREAWAAGGRPTGVDDRGDYVLWPLRLEADEGADWLR